MIDFFESGGCKITTFFWWMPYTTTTTMAMVAMLKKIMNRQMPTAGFVR